MRNLFRKIRSDYFNYHPLVKVVIDSANLKQNYLLIQKTVGKNVDAAPVLKSNAYGHGLVEVAKILEKQKPPIYVVDSYYEALVLRNEGIKTPILIIGFSILPNVLNSNLNDVSFVIADIEWLKELTEKLSRKIKFHLKIDTGMNRQGIELENIDEAIHLIKSNENIELEGVCSHLADGDSDNKIFTNKQIKKWNNVVRLLRGEFPEIKYWHLGATSSLYFNKKIDANMMRLGLGLYGINTDPKLNLPLRPVMAVETIISSIREVKKGEKIGYNCTFEAKENMKVATIPMGYFEGIDRRLSNCGYVKIGNNFCPIVGRVSMNITLIDVSEVDDAKIGDEVVVISSDPKDQNSVENIARICRTIPYEILVHVERKLRREVV